MAERSLVTDAIQANKDHQYALRVYTERLENELKTVDKLIAAIESDDELDDLADNGLVTVEGAVRATSLAFPRQLLSEDSPFYKDASWKDRYDDFTTVNQMRAKEHEALRDAVRIENIRMCTLEAQRRHQIFDVQAYPPDYFEKNIEGLDWKRVANKLNAAVPSGTNRSSKECEIRWLGYLHPTINQSSWSAEEIKQVKAIVADLEAQTPGVPIKWEEVSLNLGTNRTAIDCMRNGMTKEIHTWTPESDKKLIEAVSLFGMNNWQLVAMNVSEYVTSHQCQKRYFDTLDPNLKNGPWSPEEDEKLLRAISAFSGIPNPGEGSSTSTSNTTKTPIPWQEVAQFVPGRNNNQCRERYQDRLMKPKAKGRITKTASQGSRKGKERAVQLEREGSTSQSTDVDMEVDSLSVNQTPPPTVLSPPAGTQNLAKPKPNLIVSAQRPESEGVEVLDPSASADNTGNTVDESVITTTKASLPAKRGRNKGPSLRGINKKASTTPSLIERENSTSDIQMISPTQDNDASIQLTKKRKESPLSAVDESSARDRAEAVDNRRRSSRLSGSRN